MHRADRLFQLVQLLRGRRRSTAAFVAERMQVSVRTVYRDVAQLQGQGVPIEGEAGIGYRLGAGFDLPPMMFSKDEARALVASVRLAQAWLDPASQQTLEMLQILREAAQSRSKLQICYRDKDGQASERTVRPLGCFCWGSVWTLGAWCEGRSDFRSFRVDRIASIRRLEAHFQDEPGRSLADLLRRESAQRLLQDQ